MKSFKGTLAIVPEFQFDDLNEVVWQIDQHLREMAGGLLNSKLRVTAMNAIGPHLRQAGVEVTMTYDNKAEVIRVLVALAKKLRGTQYFGNFPRMLELDVTETDVIDIDA